MDKIKWTPELATKLHSYKSMDDIMKNEIIVDGITYVPKEEPKIKEWKIRPKIGDEYHWVDSIGNFGKEIWKNDSADLYHYYIGNCHPTRILVEHAEVKRRATTLLLRAFEEEKCEEGSKYSCSVIANKDNTKVFERTFSNADERDMFEIKYELSLRCYFEEFNDEGLVQPVEDDLGFKLGWNDATKKVGRKTPIRERF